MHVRLFHDSKVLIDYLSVFILSPYPAKSTIFVAGLQILVISSHHEHTLLAFRNISASQPLCTNLVVILLSIIPHQHSAIPLDPDEEMPPDPVLCFWSILTLSRKKMITIFFGHLCTSNLARYVSRVHCKCLKKLYAIASCS